MADPLFDTLFRSTALPSAPPAIASAAPVREAGTRSRAGNAMNRTRAALLDGARRAVEASGTKITMAQVAASAGVAKATLYNHFRTREAVLDALLQDEVRVLTERAAGKPLADALAATAAAISESPLLRTLARIEPATVACLGRIDRTAIGWQRARAAVDAALSVDARGGGELVLRWLASFLLSPARPADIAADLAVLIAALPDVPGAAEVAESA
ncbi:MAG TPA: helix-turn-helix domain-containing protein [Jatrophihabitantaceae bacterium]|jgi:AcrR family transcriptional regulator